MITKEELKSLFPGLEEGLYDAILEILSAKFLINLLLDLSVFQPHCKNTV